ncbi:glycosyltransferase family 2 protein [Salirhabdus salicampi]|uniref:glycosyltransferase family 2 protein n=1 Tax=Salirhabdus salicampi TaxID=476102 RepID=UPI0020C46607|nr:glycosyltransferase [Salirhabdus salicampi]MCP8617499.1 glycosyltransferase [Salirhabdus salicampi]
MHKVSVLIPTYNAHNYIIDLLSKLSNQEIGNDELEIIIVDSSSKDDTVELVQNNFPNVQVFVIPNDQFDHGGTRNLLVSKASGDYLLFMTQDAIPYDNYLIQNLLSSFTDDVLISYARQIPRESAKPTEQFARSFNYPDRGVIKDKSTIEELGIKNFFNSNVCSMYKREVFDSYQFPEKIILNEDMILASETILDGYKVCYAHEARVYHSHNYTMLQQFKRYFDIGMAFKDTEYLLKYASNEKEGAKFVKQLLRYLFKKRYYYLIPVAVLETMAKYAGYLLGKNHKKLPVTVKRTLSAYMK